MIYTSAMAKAIQAEKLIRKAGFKHGCTPTGIKWLSRVLDPFKDVEETPVGYPDLNLAQSVIMEKKYQVEIDKGSSSANWDCNIFFDGLLTTSNQYSTTYTGNSVYQRAGQGATPYLAGGVVVRRGDAGTTLGTTSTSTNVPIPTSDFQNGTCRPVAMAFEVHNTTSPLNKQGSVTTYRVPGSADGSGDRQLANVIEDTATAALPSSYPAATLPKVPTTAAEAEILPGSKIWEAKDGCYVVPILGSQENDPRELEPVFPIRVEGATRYAPLLQTTGAAKLIFTANNCVESPYVPCGAYFTGLSNSTTLKLVVRYYIEKFVDLNDQSLTVLAKPSAPFDPRALELYAKVASHLPTGVQVRSNGLGDWISGIARGLVQAARNVIPVINAGENVASMLEHTGYMRPMSFSDSLGPSRITNNTRLEPQRRTFTENPFASVPQVLNERFVGNGRQTFKDSDVEWLQGGKASAKAQLAKERADAALVRTAQLAKKVNKEEKQIQKLQQKKMNK
jgi:hypothetical protein